VKLINRPDQIGFFLCERCSGLWLPGTVVVPFMGRAPVLPAAHSLKSGTPLKCPDDGRQLIALHHHRIEIDLCAHCGGVWLDRGELEPILKRQAAQGERGRLLDAVGNSPKLLDAALEAGPDLIGYVLEFIGDALSGW
jgi:Zn-finger nucleic acid-binding protein